MELGCFDPTPIWGSRLRLQHAFRIRRRSLVCVLPLLFVNKKHAQSRRWLLAPRAEDWASQQPLPLSPMPIAPAGKVELHRILQRPEMQPLVSQVIFEYVRALYRPLLPNHAERETRARPRAV